ncbi:MAG: glycosyltransferase [Clostridia bacterium]
MKRIAVLGFGLSGGGAERVSAIVSNYFAENGYKVLFVAAYSKEREYELHPNVEYVAVETNLKNGLLRLVARSLKVKKVVKKFKADVAYSFITDELVPISLTNIPIIPSLRIDPKYIEFDRVRWNIRNFVYKRAKNVIFQTEDARDYFEEKIRRKGVVIGNPLKDDLPVWDEEYHRKVFMTACRITKQKNIPMLINAFIRFHEKFPEYTLEVYGDGEPRAYKDEMESYAKEKGAEKYIFFKGHSKEIHNVMTKSEAFVLASDFEGLSNSMLEAMAIGLPCICTDCPPGGARAYIENEKSGMLIPVGGENELFEAMCKIAECKDFRHILSENAKYVRKKLSRDEICRQWEELI